LRAFALSITERFTSACVRVNSQIS
jgi:hypothetical protein